MSYRRFTVPVAGGGLAAGSWGDRGQPPVLALHGITANHVSLSLVAEALSDRFVLAPDLRGRGHSGALPPPYGMQAQADDVVRLLDDADVDRAVVLGHSMGGFVAVVLAHLHPDRVARLVLVDGGLPLPAPPGVEADVLLAAVIGPAQQRLSMTFGSVEEYRDFWRAHPAFAADWSAAVQAYVDYDLTGAPPQLHTRCSIDAVRADFADLVHERTYADALAGLRHDACFLRAERGMLDEPVGLFPAAYAQGMAASLPTLREQEVPGVNHYTIVLGAAGVRAVADAVTELAGSDD